MTAAQRSRVPPPPCRDGALGVGEPMWGTAPESDAHLLLLPHPGPWTPAGPADTVLPSHLRVLADAAGRRGDIRVQLVRRVGAAPHLDPDTFYFARTAGARPVLVAYPARSPRAREVMEAMADGAPPPAEARPTPPAVLVCVHGRRDPCCARFGTAVACALSDAGAFVLGTSHLGGHRFAATAVLLPTGEMFGRLTPDDAPWLAALASGRSPRVPPDRVRGRIGRPFPLQAAVAVAADRFGRIPPDDAVDVLSADAGGGVVEVRLPGLPPQRWRVRRRTSPLLRPKSCGEAPSRASAVEVAGPAGLPLLPPVGRRP